MSLRTARAQPGKVADMVAKSTEGVGLLNERHGSQFRVSVQVGGNPDLVGAAAPWESLADYQAMRESIVADDEITALLGQIGAISAETTDMIAQVLKQPGERSAIAAVTRAHMQMPKVAEAIPFGLEICEFVEARVGVEVGFLAAVTGPRSQVAWVVNHDSLDAAVSTSQRLETEPEYLDFFKRSADLFVDGSLEADIWQAVS